MSKQLITLPTTKVIYGLQTKDRKNKVIKKIIILPVDKVLDVFMLFGFSVSAVLVSLQFAAADTLELV